MNNKELLELIKELINILEKQDKGMKNIGAEFARIENLGKREALGRIRGLLIGYTSIEQIKKEILL